MSEELKPCPCCGRIAMTKQVPFRPETENSGGYYVECTVCGLTTQLMFSVMDDCRPILVEQWNRRPQDSELAALRTKLEEVRGILAGPDAGSLPNDYPLERMAADRMEERNKFMWQVRDTCTRAEEAERKLAEARAEGMEEAAKVCDEQAKEPECPERAQYCADAIRAKMKEQK